MSLLGAIQTGARGLSVASAGIDVTTQNVTGASTPGYSRRTLRTEQLSPVEQRGLFVGQGATPSAVARSADRLLGVRLIDATGAEASSMTLAENLRVAESYLNSSKSTGIAEALDQVFDALGNATTDPSDPSYRRAVVYAFDVFATTTSRIATGLAETVDAIDEQIGASLEEVNATLAEVAALNARIGRQGATLGPADLLDRRDQLILELAGAVGATADLKADGQAVVYLGGHAIVSAGDWRQLATADDAGGNATIQVAMDDGTMDATSVVGGRLGGLVEARGELEGWVGDLDAFAFAIGTAFNGQHALGFDRGGAPGADLFTLTATASGAASGLAVDAALADDPSLLAFAGAATAYGGDGVNLEALLELEDDTTMFTTGNARSALSAITADVGATVSAAQGNEEAQAALVGDLEQLRESTSGVDTDEEATHLLEFQSAYRASARVISAADEMLRALLAIGG
ncbi:MAG: flagellar hook-associated protein FlgK [Myxococcales bacterium]|nr:flagellar hook-associated protein FlgK [Myxococcales bacterium]